MRPHSDICILGPGRDNHALTRVLLSQAVAGCMYISLTPVGDGDVMAELITPEELAKQQGATIFNPGTVMTLSDCASSLAAEEEFARKWAMDPTRKTSARERSHPNQPFWKRYNKGRRW